MCIFISIFVCQHIYDGVTDVVTQGKRVTERHTKGGKLLIFGGGGGGGERW